MNDSKPKSLLDREAQQQMLDGLAEVGRFMQEQAALVARGAGDGFAKAYRRRGVEWTVKS